MTTVLNDPLSTRLLSSSVRHAYDPEVDLDWQAPPVEGLWWMLPERVSLYGTPLWNGLSEEQRIELSKHEVGSISSVGIWFEVQLMKFLLQEVDRRDPRSSWVHYALTEVADECRHSMMFGKAIEATGVPLYGPHPKAVRAARMAAQLVRGASMWSSTLIGEEPVDRWQREMMNDERVQPIVRMVSKIHVTEEARHVSFARAELAALAPKLTRRERLWHQFVTAEAAFTTMRNLVNPRVYAAVGIDPSEGRRQALANPHYRDTIFWMGEKMVPFLEEQGMIGSGRLRQRWKDSFLLR